ncbi:MAG: hypothetical protein BA863_01080 [Desulfovibrio sp. S3730MH75]|nr:MAG: hypothetical protein BA863_01080 [Desulfovibrio sp. S3730MH75]
MRFLICCIVCSCCLFACNDQTQVKSEKIETVAPQSEKRTEAEKTFFKSIYKEQLARPNPEPVSNNF